MSASDDEYVSATAQAAPVFLTGASGYIGGRLAPFLLDKGYRVRCLAREPRKLDERPWRADPRVEVVRGDLSDVGETAEQMRGCRTAFYLIHSMMSRPGSYAEEDRALAERFTLAASEAGVERIIYLGGLGEMGEDLSEHLRSRREVERTLASGTASLTTLRAAMIIGSGSASFEILRYLVERLPVMVTPRWVSTESQPIGVYDVLQYLEGCLRCPETTGRTLEIGGTDVVRYCELMQVMAEELELPRRFIIPVPVLTPRLSSRWIGLVTPVPPRIAHPLAEGLRNKVVVNDPSARELVPFEPASVRRAIRTALTKTRDASVETRWSAAGVIPGDPDWAGGTVFEDKRTIEIEASADDVYAAVCRVGGGHGWYAADFLWRVRGWMDMVLGGPGLRRGRRDPERVEFGESLDFWRVVGIERGRLLSLRAEMVLPGEAMLDFRITPEGDDRSELEMVARFRPKGLLGLAYWYAVFPLHGFVFSGMLRGVRRAAHQRAGDGASAVT